MIQKSTNLVLSLLLLSLGFRPARADDALTPISGHRVSLVSVWIPKDPDPERQSRIFDRARDWYRDVLEFKVIRDLAGTFDGVAGRWIELQMPSQPSLKLVLKAGTPVSDDTSFSLAPASADELCDFYGRLKAKSALHPKYPTPVRRPWALEFAARDPFGNTIAVGVPTEELEREESRRSRGELPPRTNKCEADPPPGAKPGPIGRSLIEGAVDWR